MSFSSGGDLGGAFAAAFAYFYVAKNHLHFYSQNLEKNEGLGRPKWLQKLIFSSFGGHFLTIIFHITFCINFFTVFYRFLEAPTLKNSYFPLGKTMIFTKSTFSRWKPNFIEKSPPKPFILGARITRKLQKINKKNIPKNNYVLRPFFWILDRFWDSGFSVLGLFLPPKINFFTLFLELEFLIDFEAFWEGFGRVWGGFGKGFWRFGEGFLSGFREFCDHFYIDFYNFYRFRGATLLSLFFLAILKVASRKRVSWKQNPCGCHSLGHSSLNHGPAACAKRSAAPPGTSVLDTSAQHDRVLLFICFYHSYHNDTSTWPACRKTNESC